MRRVVIDFSRRTCVDNITSWADHMARLGFDEIILATEDVFMNPDISEIAQKLNTKSPDLTLFTNGEYLRADQIRETPGDVVFPVDWEHPFTAEVLGESNYNSKMDFALRFTGADVWQTFLGDNFEQLVNTGKQMSQHGINWECHLSETKPPDELIQFCRQNEFRVVPLSEWYFVHEKRHVPEPFEEEVIRENRSYAGGLYIDESGVVHSISSEFTKPVFAVTRENIHKFSLTSDMVTA